MSDTSIVIELCKYDSGFRFFPLQTNLFQA